MQVWKGKRGESRLKYRKSVQTVCLILIFLLMFCTIPTFAAQTTGGKDIFGVAHDIIIKEYNSIAGISTILAGLMSAVAVVSLKFSSSQQKSDQAFSWLKRIWVAWAVINGIGAFLAYVVPMFQGYNSLEGFGTSSGVSSGSP